MTAFRLTVAGKAIAAAGAATLAFAATPAAADVISYDVTDAASGKCPHGLWTNTRNSGCSKYFSFQDGSTFSLDTDSQTGTFTGVAINDLGETAVIDLSLSGFLSDISGTGFTYKAGGGPYDASVMDFFTNAAGSITIDGEAFTLNPNDPLAGHTTFQFGQGANDFTGDFGGSAWLNILNPLGHVLKHWDINFDLAQRPTAVPAPGGVALFGLGLIGLWAGQRRRRRTPAMA